MDPQPPKEPASARSRGQGGRRLRLCPQAPDEAEWRIAAIAADAGPLAVVTGWAAALLHGAVGFDGRESDGTPTPVPLRPLGGLRVPAGAVLVRGTLPPARVERLRGLDVMSPEAAVFDEVVRRADPVEGVVALDLACAGEITSLPRLAVHLREAAGRRGIRLFREALKSAAESSRSAQETRVRLAWVETLGVPAPLGNRPIYTHAGETLGIPALFDPRHAVAAEFPGSPPRGRARRRAVDSRAARFADHGIVTFDVLADDEPAAVIGRLLDALEREGQGAAPGPPAWTLTPPPGAWVPRDLRSTLDQRIADRGGPDDDLGW